MNKKGLKELSESQKAIIEEGRTYLAKHRTSLLLSLAGSVNRTRERYPTIHYLVCHYPIESPLGTMEGHNDDDRTASPEELLSEHQSSQ